MPTSTLSDKLRNKTQALHDEIRQLSSERANISEQQSCILNYTGVYWGCSSWLDRLHTKKSSMLIRRSRSEE